MIKLFSTILSFSIFVANTGWSQTANMARIEKGGYVPLYGANSTKVFVEDFYLDIYPVTNKQFLEFLKNNPKWRR